MELKAAVKKKALVFKRTEKKKCVLLVKSAELPNLKGEKVASVVQKW